MTAEPMTETDLAAIRASAARSADHMRPALSGPDREHATAVLHRSLLLDEVDRLHTWDGLMSLLDEHWPEDLFPGSYDPSRDDGARIVGLLRWVGNLVGDVESCESRVRSYESVNAELRGELDELRAYHIDHCDRVTRGVDALLAKLEAALKLRCCVCDTSLGYVNHTGLQFCGPCANGETSAPEMPRAPAESHGDGLPAEKRPEGRTGVSETLSDAQVSDSHWLKFNADRQVTGCECGFRADIDSDCGFGDSVVRHLLEVGAEAAVPDVDGWEITATPRGPMVSHSTDADLRVLVADQGDPLPVGAVLAFIADQRPELVAYEAHCDNCKTTSEKGRTDER